MARPPAKELTERELQIMQLFWKHGELTAAEAREALAQTELDLAYTTVATLVKILVDKDFLQQTNTERPYRFVPVRSYEDVSGRLLGDLVERVFAGSRELLLTRLLEQKRLTAKERAFLEQFLREQKEARR
ncbi:MAG: BlaI/MecI/CopY family transcriptional regulator [Pirellulales bacterium]